MDKRFIYGMYKEEQNNRRKGNWDNWKPHPETWLWELQYHISKLQKSIISNNKKEIKEYSCDIGLFAEKSYMLYGGINKTDRKSLYVKTKMLKHPSKYELLKRDKKN